MEQSSTDTTKSHYSFGDNDLAGKRLEYLAAAFAPSSLRFLQDAKPDRVELALDLGSGIGASTALVRDVTRAPRVVGYERSASFLEVARRHYPELTLRDVDILSPKYPDQEGDLIYCRFLLTHIHRPLDVLTTSVRHLRLGGRLLLEETAAMFSPVPTLSRYYDLVQQLQAHHGQETLIGKRLGALAAGVAGVRVTSLLQEIPIAASLMARLHAMNLSTWKADPFMLETHGLLVLEDLEGELKAIAARSDLPEGHCVMAQVCIERGSAVDSGGLAMAPTASARRELHSQTQVLTRELRQGGPRIALLGEFDSKFPPHIATAEAIQHSATLLGISVFAEWVSTSSINESLFDRFDALWVLPGSPYRDLGKTLWAIRHAREKYVPCIGTCGGFQHMVLEYARNVLGYEDAQHAEYDPYASTLFVSALACSLAGREMELHFEPNSRIAGIYGTLTATEQYYCNFGVDPNKVNVLKSGPLRVSGSDSEGEVRVIEHPEHPFFIGTLFVPQSRSQPQSPHPLVTAFLTSILARDRDKT
jgi:SAM-dependent methyltransferase